ncbi:metal ABC transporter ATP-binding protein [Fictibacillus sp. 23RED33]|uniref:metal ABC transporter ATP-binding protein n=1 Tax=Fictibacillus sp. 23RED33 TaxID=2745879 RepID=UPI0018CF2078|nr:metal ABC transporter ATP-binding protein [Fictibacillus sp. 23RED33]MBH0174619.1 metal ABC transporter ATP-binding protein [Fictibacillus sp. 23RED33]
MIQALQINHLYVSYLGNQVVKDISFSVKQGSLVGIIGPNGAGKSTMMKAALNLIPKDKGDVSIFGESLKKWRKKIAYVPQRSDIDWDFPITVFDVVLLGTYPKLGLFKRPSKSDREWAYECLKIVGMETFSNRQIGELSGGQQQRVFLARALAQKAELFFLDEPFVGIDVASEETIIHILRDLKKEGKTILVVHHDLSKAESYFDHLLLLNKNMIQFGASEEVLRPEVITKAYANQFSFLQPKGVNVTS